MDDGAKVLNVVKDTFCFAVLVAKPKKFIRINTLSQNAWNKSVCCWDLTLSLSVRTEDREPSILTS